MKLKFILSKTNNLDIKFIISQLACSEDENNSRNILQLKRFKEILEMLPNIPASLANSGGIYLGKDYHFDMVRPGAALYGLRLSDKMHDLLNPIKLTAPIVHIQELSKGDKIGYNGTFEAEKHTIIATVCVGYRDGFMRSFSNKGKVYIDNEQVSVVGKVSMDYITVDVTGVSEEKIFLGKKVEIIGSYIRPDIMSSHGDTIGYEILTNLGNRYKRIYKDVHVS